MPKAFPIEFRRDVVAVARKGKAPLSQVAKDSGEDAHADAALVQVVGDDQDMPLSSWIKSLCTAQPQD